MISLVADRQPHFTLDNVQSDNPKWSRRESRPDRVLIAEHRDEVFARLAADLRESDHTVFRASCADDVARMYSYGQIELVLFNFLLPCNDIWLNARKLRAFDAYARIWLYVPAVVSPKLKQEDLSRIEHVVAYDGSLFQLSDEIRDDLNELASHSSFATPSPSSDRASWREQVLRMSSKSDR